MANAKTPTDVAGYTSPVLLRRARRLPGGTEGRFGEKDTGDEYVKVW